MLVTFENYRQPAARVLLLFYILAIHAYFCKESLISSRDALASTMPDIHRSIVNLLSSGEQAIGLGFTALELFTDQLPRCDFYSIMTKLSEQNKLLLPNS